MYLGAYSFIYEYIKQMSVVEKRKHTKKIIKKKVNKKYITVWGGRLGKRNKKDKTDVDYKS